MLHWHRGSPLFGQANGFLLLNWPDKIWFSRRVGPAMIKILMTYAAMLIVFIACDLLWIGVIAQPMYQQGIGHLMTGQPNLWAAISFYLIFPAGLLYLVPAIRSGRPPWRDIIPPAAILGFVAYATYDLSNLATLKDWPVLMSLADMIWGTALTMVTACAGYAAQVRFTG